MEEIAENNHSITTQSKGGLKYELVLKEPFNDTPPKISGALESPKVLSAEEIKNKLRVAEDRRKSIEAQRIRAAKDSISKIFAIKEKFNEMEEKKMESTRQTIQKKMQTFKENRDTHINAIMEKQKEHGEKVAQVVKRKSDEITIFDSSE